MAKIEELIVRRIRNGTVIDHVSGGQAMNVLKMLGMSGKDEHTVAMVMNVDSRRIGKKDILKIEGRELAPGEVDKIALIAPEATINTVKNYRVTKKVTVKLPDEIKGIINCTNPRCISNKESEPVKPSFKVASRAPIILVCRYCGAYISQSEVVAQYTRAG